MNQSERKQIIEETIQNAIASLKEKEDALACHVAFVQDSEETVAIMHLDPLPEMSFVFTLHGMHAMESKTQRMRIMPIRYSSFEEILLHEKWLPLEGKDKPYWLVDVGGMEIDIARYDYAYPVSLFCHEIAMRLKECKEEHELTTFQCSPSIILAMRHWNEPEDIIDECIDILSHDHYVDEKDWDQLISSSTIYEKIGKSDLCLFFVRRRTLRMQEFSPIVHWHPNARKMIILEEYVPLEEIEDLLQEGYEIFCLYLYDDPNALLKRMNEAMDRAICKPTKDEGLWLGDRVFANCHNLQDLHLTQGIVYYGRACLEECTRIDSFIFQQGTKYVPERFFHHSKIQTISLPEGMKSIGDHAFEGCQELREVILPPSIIHIHEGAFQNCSNLKTIRIPACCQIDEATFAGCSSLSSVIFYGDDSEQNNVRLAPKTFQDCSSLQEIFLPEHVEEVGSYAFAGCTALQAVHASNVHVGDHAFDTCTSLMCLDANVDSLGEYSFVNCSNLKDIQLDMFVEEIPAYAFFGCRSLHRLTLPKYCDSIGEYAFANCDALVNLSRSHLSQINAHAFENCISLKEFDITGTAYVGTYAFAGCTSLEHVDWEEYVCVDSYAFKNCTSLKQTIEDFDSLVTFCDLPRNAFEGCDQMQDVIEEYYGQGEML